MIDDKRYTQLIETKELPIVSFCVFCDKPIYIGEDYFEVEYYGNSSKKHLHKKDLTKGFAHKECALKKQNEVLELKEADKRSNTFYLTLGIVLGFVLMVTLLVIFLLTKAMHVALAIIVPLLIGYAVTSSIFVLMSDNKVGRTYSKLAYKMFRFPINVVHSDSTTFLKILLLVFITPLDYIGLVLITLLSMIISMVYFQFVLLILKNNNHFF